MKIRLITAAVAVALAGVAVLAPASAYADVVRIGAESIGDSYQGGLTVAPSGDVYALRSAGWYKVFRFTSGLAFGGSWGGSGSGDGKFGSARGVAVTTAGEVLVGEAGGYRVQRFSPTGSYLGTFATNQVEDLAAGRAGGFYVTNGSVITRHDAAGVELARSIGSGATPSVGYVHAIAYDAGHDRVFAVDSSRNLVRVFDGATLQQIAQWGATGTAPGMLDSPSDIAVDAVSHDVYVAEPRTVVELWGRVQRFSAAGVFRGLFAYGWGSTNAVAVDSSERLYISLMGALLRVDPDVPVAALSATPESVRTGEAMTLDASTSIVPFGQIDNFAWDLDGDGSFETDGATTPTFTTSFTTPGTHTVGVRVSGGGRTDTESATLTVIPEPNPPQPPNPNPEPVGVSIEDGALYTNDPTVTIGVVAPHGAKSITVANDGGFKNARTFSVGSKVSWTLASSGPERLPKTVYVRFSVTGDQNFSDDIILNQTAPTVSPATLASSSSPATSRAVASAASSRPRTYLVRLRAKDQTSGVAKLQFATNRRRPGALRRFERNSRDRGARAPKYVRVRDRAGNFSRWRSIR